MLSGRELFSAKVALGGQPNDAFPNVSRELLAEGNDGPAMRQLAALEGAGSWTDGPVLDAALAEIGLQRISKRLAALRLAHDVAKGMLEEPELSFPVWSSALPRLWVSSGYVDDLAFVDDFDPHWSAYFDTEDAARSALKRSLEQIAAFDLSGGEAALPQAKAQSFRSLVAPVRQVKATVPSLESPHDSGRSFRERWRDAKKRDEGLLRWIIAWGLLWLAVLYCQAVGGPRLRRFEPFLTRITWLSFIYYGWFRDGRLLSLLLKGWTGLRTGRITLQSAQRALLRWAQGLTMR